MEKFDLSKSKEPKIGEKDRLKQRLEAKLKSEEDKQAMAVKQIQNADSIATSSETGDTRKTNIKESKENPFNLEEIKELKERLDDIKSQLKALRNPWFQLFGPVEQKRGKLIDIGHQLLKIVETGDYARTRQNPSAGDKTKDALKSIRHLTNKILSDYREKVNAGKAVRKQWKALTENWLEHKKWFGGGAVGHTNDGEHSIALNTLHFEGLYSLNAAEYEEQESKIHYPSIKYILEAGETELAGNNLSGSRKLQKIGSGIRKILQRIKQNETTQETGVVLLDSEVSKIEEAIEELDKRIKSVNENRKEGLEKRNASDFLTWKRNKEGNCKPIPASLVGDELQLLGLGKDMLTLRLLQKLKSEPSCELMKKVIEISGLSVREYHKKYNCEIWRATEDIKKCYESFNQFEEQFNIFRTNDGNYDGLEEYLSTFQDKNVRNLTANIHIKGVSEAYTHFIASLKQQNSSIELIVNSAPDHIGENIRSLISDGEKNYNEKYNELLKEAERKLPYDKVLNELLRKTHPEGFSKEPSEPIIGRIAFKDQLLPYLISASKAIEDIKLATRIVLYGVDPGDNDLEYESYPFRPSAEIRGK
jgi:tetrahydromethanopterin S-methyltransferase subunit G